MSLVDAVIARLKAQVPVLRSVEGAAGFQRASETKPLSVPAAYVFLVDESAVDLSLDTPLVQQLQITLAVVLVIRQVGDVTGAAATTDMETVRSAVRGALHGYSMDTDHDPLAILQSALVAFREGFLWWQESYRSSYYVTALSA